MTAKPSLAYIITVPFSAMFFLRGQLRYFREQGYEVTLITSPGPELTTVREREGIRVVEVPMRREPSPLHDLISLARLTSILRSLQPEIVHYSTPKASFLGSIAALLARVPVRLMTLRGLRGEGLKQPARSLLYAMERFSCSAAHRVYCVSESLRSRALELKLAPADKLTVIGRGTGNGIDADHFSRTANVIHRAEMLREQQGISTSALVIGFVGRLVRDKGVAELVAAFRALKPLFAKLTLLLVGPFEDYDGLPTDVRSEIADDPQIVHLGYQEDPAPAYALMTVFALPTYREGFPNTALEAACMELPVVVTRVTGCIDAVVDGETGTTVPPRDVSSLANAIHVYLSQPELCRTHGAAGRRRALRDFHSKMIWSSLQQDAAKLMQGNRTIARTRSDLVKQRSSPRQTPGLNPFPRRATNTDTKYVHQELRFRNQVVEGSCDPRTTFRRPISAESAHTFDRRSTSATVSSRILTSSPKEQFSTYHTSCSRRSSQAS